MEENNKSDNLITTEKPKLNNIENPYIIISESSDESDLEIIRKSEFFLIFIMFYIIFGIPGLAVCITLPIVYGESQYIFFSLLDILPLLLALYFFKKKLILRKNNKQLTIIEQNHLFLSKKYDISLKNINVQIGSSGYYKGFCHRYFLSKLIIYGIDSTKINFDTENIKNIPHKFFYIFYNCVIDQNSLYNFLGINTSQDKFIDEINEYIPNSKEKEILDKNQQIINYNLLRLRYAQFLKLSEHYYSYYSYNFASELKSNENFQRIDWIYSENYDKIFIGIVKNNNSYLNTFTFDTNTINKYILEVKGDKLYLKIILNDEEVTNLCEFKNNYAINNYALSNRFNTLLYLLNGQINKYNNKNKNEIIPTDES